MVFIKNITLIAIISIIFSCYEAKADTMAATNFVNDVGRQVIEIVSDKKSNISVKEEKLNSLFIENVDITWIAKFVVGRYWREATEAQKEQYIGIYKKFLVSRYVSQFTRYTDQKMSINRSTQEDEGEYVVDTAINDQDGKSYNIAYKIRKEKQGKLLIYDIVAEGISLITTQRAEFGSILAREGMAALIEKLEQKI